MADTPENTAASMNATPATTRKASVWRRVRRAIRVVAAVVLGVVCVLALVAWPSSSVWIGGNAGGGGGVNVRRAVTALSTDWAIGMANPPANPTPRPVEVGTLDVDLAVIQGEAVLNLWSLDATKSPTYDGRPLTSSWEASVRRTDPGVRRPWLNPNLLAGFRTRVHVAGVYVFTSTNPSPGFMCAMVVVPLWMIAAVTGVPAVLLWRGVIRRRRGANECVTCGYSRVGLPSWRTCPECGAGSGGRRDEVP